MSEIVVVAVAAVDKDGAVSIGTILPDGRLLDVVVSADGTIHAYDSDTDTLKADHGLPDVAVDALRAYATAKRRLGRGAV